MRFIYLFLFTFFVFDFAFSQEVTYFDVYGYVLVKKRLQKNAAFFQVEEKTTNGFSLKRYTKDSVLISFENFEDKQLASKNGKVIYYDYNGMKTTEGIYSNGEKEGLWIYYHKKKEAVKKKTHYKNGKKEGLEELFDKDGALLEELSFSKNEYHGFVKVWNDQGLLMTEAKYKNGKREGFFKSFYSNRKPAREELYKDDELVSSKYFTPEGRDTSYFPYIVYPQFPGCNFLNKDEKKKKECAERKLLEFIYMNIQYPHKAIQHGIEGTAIVKFLVDKTGEISELEMVKSLSGDTDEECFRIVQMFPKFIPGYVDRVASDIYFHLPIKFRLE